MLLLHTFYLLHCMLTAFTLGKTCELCDSKPWLGSCKGNALPPNSLLAIFCHCSIKLGGPACMPRKCCGEGTGHEHCQETHGGLSVSKPAYWQFLNAWLALLFWSPTLVCTYKHQMHVPISCSRLQLFMCGEKPNGL